MSLSSIGHLHCIVHNESALMSRELSGAATRPLLGGCASLHSRLCKDAAAVALTKILLQLFCESAVTDVACLLLP